MAEIEIQRIGRKTMKCRIVGTAPLIVHRFNEKAKQQMLDAQQGRKNPKETRDPEKDFQGARYLMEDGSDGFPAVGFKAAAIAGARLFGKSVTMTSLKPALLVVGEGPDQLVKLDVDPPVMREDYVRVGMGTDLRYRPAFWPWAAVLTIVYQPTVLSIESVLSLLDAGGGGGIGEWRPSAKALSGTFGTFQVDDDYEVQEIG